MNILVTGGAGFIGSNFSHYIFENYTDAKITILDKLTYAGSIENVASIIDEERVNFVQGDIANEEFVNALFEEQKFTHVVNFAAETHVDRSIINPDPFVDTNINGTATLLKISKKYGVERYHQVSTDEVYGDLGKDSTDFFTEETPMSPNCPYAATKAAADIMVLSYARTYDFPATVSRCSNNYGPYQFPEKFIPRFLYLLKEDKNVPIYGDGIYVRDWLYVIDHCRAIDMILQKGTIGEVYNIGGNFERTNLEIVKILINFMGKSEDLLTFVEDRKAHDRRYAIDSSKIQKELGWEPSVTFEEGIKKKYEWYENNQDWVKAVTDKIKDNNLELEHRPLGGNKQDEYIKQFKALTDK